jgi:hypothetical protein
MKKLFLIEFGQPESSNYSQGMFYFTSGGVNPNSAYVVADNYEQALIKAAIYVEGKSGEKRSVVDYDGSLNLNNLEIKIKAIKLISEEVVI